MTGTGFKLQNLSTVRKGVAWLMLASWLAAAPAAHAQPGVPLSEPPPAPTPDTRQQYKVGQLLLVRAEKLRREGTRLFAEGNVNIELAGISLDCQRLEFDQLTGIVKARRECLFQWGENYAAAESVDFDINANKASMRKVAGRGADLVQNDRRVEAPLYFWADRLEWVPGKVRLIDAMVTTCDEIPGDWHYSLESEQVDIFPRDRLEASNTVLTLEGAKLYTLPTVILSLNPKRKREQSFFPTPGYNRLTGGFLRNTFQYAIDEGNFGKLHLDYYTVSGIGGGLEHELSFGDRGGAKLYYYRQKGVQSTQNREDLRANVGYALDEYTNIGASYSQNQFELPGLVFPISVGGSFAISRLAPGSVFLASTNFSRFGDNTNANYKMFYEHDFNEELTGQLQADFIQAATSIARSHRFHYLGSLSHRGEIFDSQLVMENTGGQQTYYLNRNPEFQVRTHPVYLGPVPILASAGIGNLQESPSLYRTSRYDFRLQIPDQNIELPLGRLQFGGGIRQMTYGNGLAQYILLGRGGWVQNLGDFAVGRVDFNYQQPKGYTPFQTDLHFPFSTVTGGLEFHRDDFFALSASYGYDLKFKQTHDLIARLDVRPTQGWLISASSNYDPRTSLWRTVDSQINMKLTDNLSVTHWSVYDFFNNRMTYQDFAVNYEHHDWIASVAYRGVQQEVFFQFSLKAFPAPQPQVGPALYTPVLPQNLPNAFVR